MHTCPPCRQFTPILADLYSEVNADQKSLEIIFMSGDKNVELYNDYYKEMPWLALPFQHEKLRDICMKYEVKAVPRLVIMKQDGTILNKNAV